MIDLHTHSSCSDGELEPQKLIDLAACQGITQLAITDHDTMAAYRLDLVIPEQMQLIPGIELSSSWRGWGIHLVGLGVDVSSKSMQQAEQVQAEAREIRFDAICQALRKRGLVIDIQRLREGIQGAPGRPHIARYLVDTGQAASLSRAFRKYLSNSRLAFAQKCWPELFQCIEWVHRAGGVSVLAHPLKYGFTHSRLNSLLQEFVEAGGMAMEVVSGSQTQADTAKLLAMAASYKLAVSVGSDHHGIRAGNPCLGVEHHRVAGIDSLLAQLKMH